MSSRIRLKIGDIEAEYEGNDEFLQDGLIKLISDAVDRFDHHPAAHRNPGRQPKREQALDQSTNTVASILGGKTGAELTLAAAAHLALVKAEPKFTRKQILTEMKEAATYYKSTYNNNLTAILNGLVKSKTLNFVSKDTYALGPTERSTIEAKLAEHR